MTEKDIKQTLWWTCLHPGLNELIVILFFCNLILKHETKFNRQYIYIKELCIFKV